MINPLEVPMILQEAIPEFSESLIFEEGKNVYKLMDALKKFTCKNISEHNFNVVKRCFNTADILYSKGNTVVQNAVQNVYIFSFTNIFQTYYRERSEVLSIIPISLYSLYIAQVHHSGC